MKDIGVGEKAFACHRLMYRTPESTKDCKHDIWLEKETGEKPIHFPTIQKAGKLHQQIVVDYAARIVDHKLHCVGTQQRECKVENYTVVMDALAEYDELTVEGLLREILDKCVACDDIEAKVLTGPNTLEEYDQAATS